MMETAIGILARTPGDERAGVCDAALSSGVPDAINGLDAQQGAAGHIEILISLWRRLQRLRKKGPNPYVILSEAKNLSFFSWS